MAGGAAIGGSLVSGLGARSAAKSQERAAQQQLALQERVYDETVERFQPFVGAGENALAAINYELGLGERPTFGGTPLDITEVQTANPNRVQVGVHGQPGVR